LQIATEKIFSKHHNGNTCAVSSVQFSCSLPWTAACQASLSVTNSQSLLELMSIESVMPFNYLILSCPLLLLPTIFPSIRVFWNESVLHIRWPKYCCFSFNHQSFQRIFRTDFLYDGLVGSPCTFTCCQSIWFATSFVIIHLPFLNVPLVFGAGVFPCLSLNFF